MPTFHSKEIVDAWQFDGSKENARELVTRVKAYHPDYRCSNLSISQGISMLGSKDPAIEVPTPCLTIDFGDDPKDWWSLRLNPTDWLVRKQSGRLMVQSDESFKKKYNQV